ncbi:unnamed protein product [Clavelina lepadiformis]|uniref:Uncharacterized protein n=1 Tax=Clavelina lepadiformis TaxID=159417 RepID=A0ABP0GAS7_CLALP
MSRNDRRKVREYGCKPELGPINKHTVYTNSVAHWINDHVVCKELGYETIPFVWCQDHCQYKDKSMGLVNITDYVPVPVTWQIEKKVTYKMKKKILRWEIPVACSCVRASDVNTIQPRGKRHTCRRLKKF